MASESSGIYAKSNTLQLSDCMCPICMSILIEPVRLPCKHELCMPCFQSNVHKTSLTCPMCRVRISTWTRRATKNNTLVDSRRWKQIKEAFPRQVERRLLLQGVEDDVIEDESPCDVAELNHNIAQPGEIRQEYEKELEKIKKQRELDQQREAEASLQLILQIQNEEEKQQEELEKIKRRDEELAKELSDRLKKEKSVLETPYINQFLKEKQKLADYTCTPHIQKNKSALTCKRKDTIDRFLSPVRHKSPANIHESQHQIRSASRTLSQNSNNFDSFEEDESPVIIPGNSNAMLLQADNCRTRSCSLSSASDRLLRNASSLSTSSCKSADVWDDVKPSADVELEKSGLLLTDIAEVEPVTKDEQPLRSSSITSNDSITLELSHFKPIESCPRTPPKRLPGGRVVKANVIRSTPINLLQVMSSPAGPSKSPRLPVSSPVINRRLNDLAAERQARTRSLSKSTNTENVPSLRKFMSPKGKLLSRSLIDKTGLDDSVKRKPVTDADTTIPLLPLEPDLEDCPSLPGLPSLPYEAYAKDKAVSKTNTTPARPSPSRVYQMSRPTRKRPAQKADVCNESHENQKKIPQTSLSKWLDSDQTMGKCTVEERDEQKSRLNPRVITTHLTPVSLAARKEAVARKETVLETPAMLRQHVERSDPNKRITDRTKAPSAGVEGKNRTESCSQDRKKSSLRLSKVKTRSKSAEIHSSNETQSIQDAWLRKKNLVLRNVTQRLETDQVESKTFEDPNVSDEESSPVKRRKMDRCDMCKDYPLNKCTALQKENSCHETPEVDSSSKKKHVGKLRKHKDRYSTRNKSDRDTLKQTTLKCVSSSISENKKHITEKPKEQRSTERKFKLKSKVEKGKKTKRHDSSANSSFRYFKIDQHRKSTDWSRNAEYQNSTNSDTNDSSICSDGMSDGSLLNDSVIEDEKVMMQSFEEEEDEDRQFALQLQAQFDAEAKLRLSAIRMKGSDGEYMLRQKRTVKT